MSSESSSAFSANHSRAPLIAFALFITVSGLAGIKLVIGAPLHWALALTAILAWALFRAEPLLNTVVAPFAGLVSRAPEWLLFWGAWVCFCLGILIAGWVNGGAGVYTVPKYLALMGVLWLLVSFVPKTEELVSGLYLLAAVGGVGFLIVWLGGFSDWLELPPKRYGWALLPPGVLWKAGVFLIPPLCWVLLNKRYPSKLQWSFFFLACALVGLDGSRTAALLAAMIWLLFSVLVCCRFGLSNAPVKRALIIAVWMLVLIGGINPSPWNPVIHVYSVLGELVPNYPGSGTEAGNGLIQPGRELGGDSIRTAMLIEGVRGVQEHFLLGSGFGTTVAQTESMDSPMVVHMTYLQVLADTGLLGFLGYMGIFLVPLWYFFLAMRRANDSWSLFDENALPLGIVGIYMFSSLLHPISNEISEWAVVLPALAMLFKATERFESASRS